MTKTEALKKLNTLLQELEELPPFRYEGDNSNFDKWERKAGRYIEEIFENKNGQSSEFASINYTYTAFVIDYDTDFETPSILTHREGRKKAKTLLESFIEEVSEWKSTPQEEIILKINYFIRSVEILILEDNFKRFSINESFDKFKLELELFLRNTFGDISDEFTKFKKIKFLYVGPRGMERLQVPLDNSTYKDGLKATIVLLEYIKENILALNLSKIQHDSIKVTTKSEKNISNKVFIVHGHDNGAKQEVARFLEKLDLIPIILHEQASSQKTIIEKIEEYTGQVGFGVVLYTECDIGGKDKDSLQSRARQNVVFEHGYLIGLLGRDKVCPLVKGKVETPGDISGIVYTTMDVSSSWHLPLARELIAAGYDIDPKKLI